MGRMPSRVRVPFNVAVKHLLSADLLSYRMPSFRADPIGWPLSKSIAICGRGEEIHTGMVDVDENHDAVALGMRLGKQKLKLLNDEVKANPGLIDVYRYVGYTQWSGGQPCDQQGLSHGKRREIVRDMRRFALHDHYGWRGIISIGCYFVPGVRWFADPHPAECEDLQRVPFCSEAVAHVFRKHVRPLLQNRNDVQICPGDIVTSPFLLYLFTLEPSDHQHAKPIEEYYRDSLYEQLRVVG